MAMFHHDKRDYAEAASACAKHMREKLEKQIKAGVAKATALMDRVAVEAPRDAVRNAADLSPKWHVKPADDTSPAAVMLGNGIVVDLPPAQHTVKQALPVHPHALAQACQRVRMPARYANELLDNGSGWAAELLQKNLRDLYLNSDSRLLTRIHPTELRKVQTTEGIVEQMVRGELRGVLSDRYKRLDSAPLLDAFAKAAHKVGLVPIDGTRADTKWGVRALLNKLFEPIENEVMAFGAELRNSDYGDGRLALSIFVLRPWCTNFATTKNELTRVHLGARLPDDLRLSQRTHDLDTETFASAISDITGDCLSPTRVDEMCEAIKEANDATMNWSTAKKRIEKKLNKGEVERAKVVFEAEDPAQAPVKQSRWKLSNTVSWLAGQAENEGRRMELEQFAGDLIS